MYTVTENVRNYIQEKGINISNLANKTGLNYDGIVASIGNMPKRNRPLRAEEFLAICMFLEVDPRMFAEKKEET